MSRWKVAYFCCAGFIYLGCSNVPNLPGPNSNGGTGPSVSGGGGESPKTKFFPQGLALASPLKSAQGAQKGNFLQPRSPSFWQRLFPSSLIEEAHAAPGTYASAFAESTQTISGVLGGTLPAASVLSPQAFTQKAMVVECYGPSMKFTHHPDYSPTSGSPGPGPGPGPGIPAGGPSSGPDGQLPPGDLGIWLDTERGTGPLAGNACAAAKLNAQLESNSAKVNAALVALAALARGVASSDAGTLAPGSSMDLTAYMNTLGVSLLNFTQATLAIDTTGNTWNYDVRFGISFPPPPGGGTSPAPQTVVVQLSHTAGIDTNHYSGLLSVFSNDAQPMGCPSMTSGALATTLFYERRGETQLDVSARSAGYCNASPTAFPSSLLTSRGELDPNMNVTSVRTTGWSKSFDRFGGTFDPTSSTLAGSYAYAWQAGSQDSNARVFNIRLNSSTATGEAYFGYGDAIGVSDGSIKGFICNWAGPGNSHALVPLCQRQFIEFDSTAGVWKQPTGGSDIRYAPTTSCEYTHAQVSAGSTFWYDRDLTNAASGLPTEPQLIVDKTDATYPLDLMEKGGSASITDAITARGFTLPSNF